MMVLDKLDEIRKALASELNLPEDELTGLVEVLSTCWLNTFHASQDVGASSAADINARQVAMGIVLQGKAWEVRVAAWKSQRVSSWAVQAES
jgi:hypothetical protein